MGPSPQEFRDLRPEGRQVCAAHRGGEAGTSCVSGYEWEKPVRQVFLHVGAQRGPAWVSAKGQALDRGWAPGLGSRRLRSCWPPGAPCSLAGCPSLRPIFHWLLLPRS